MAQSNDRVLALDPLPPYIFPTIEVFIKTIDDEATSWLVFLNPFSSNIWVVLLIVAFFISFLLTAIEVYYNHSTNVRFCINSYVGNLWIALKANAGGKPNTKHISTSHQILMFVCLLIGSLIWMAYRASITSELSIIQLKEPFTDLDSLLDSDYK